MAAATVSLEASRHEALLAAVRARSATLGAERVRRAVLAELAIAKSDRVLELGVGSGSLLFAVAARVTQGFVAGVEPDELALRHAARRCERLVREGRVQLVRGSSEDLSAFEPASCDHVYGVHVMSFWREPAPHLAEIRRVLRPGGRLLLAAACEAAPAALERALSSAGFENVHTRSADPLIWTSAH